MSTTMSKTMTKIEESFGPLPLWTVVVDDDEKRSDTGDNKEVRYPPTHRGNPFHQSKYLSVYNLQVKTPDNHQISSWTYCVGKRYGLVAILVQHDVGMGVVKRLGGNTDKNEQLLSECSSSSSSSDRWLLFYESRLGTSWEMGSNTMAPAGGHLEPDEPPLKATQREMMEEMHLEGGDWYTLGSGRGFVDSPSRGLGVGHLYLCVHPVLSKETPKPSDDNQPQMPIMLTTAQLEDVLLDGGFHVQSWQGLYSTALLKYRSLLRAQKSKSK